MRKETYEELCTETAKLQKKYEEITLFNADDESTRKILNEEKERLLELLKNRKKFLTAYKDTANSIGRLLKFIKEKNIKFV